MGNDLTDAPLRAGTHEGAPSTTLANPVLDIDSLDRMVARQKLGIAQDVRLVVVWAAAGGWQAPAIDAAAAALGNWRWVVLGGPPASASPLVTYTWDDDPHEWLAAANVVLASSEE